MNRIKRLREEKNMLQEDLALILEVTQKTISNYENETRDIPTEYLIKLSNYFNVSIDYILCKTDIRNTSQENNTNDTPEIRALARGISKLNPEKQDLVKKLIKQMSDVADEENKK